jgi:hypothetical protein
MYAILVYSSIILTSNDSITMVQGCTDFVSSINIKYLSTKK